MVQVQGKHGRLIWKVDLPTYSVCDIQRHPQTGKPESATVWVPDDEVGPSGKIDKKRIKEKYKGQKWEKHIDEVDLGEKVK